MASKDQLWPIKRNPSLTRSAFSTYWLTIHAPLAISWALSRHCTSYIQIHNPRPSSSPSATLPSDLDISEWDGAAELIFEPPPGYIESAKSRDFLRKVIVPDEKKFLAGEGRKIAKFVNKERVVLIEGGKVRVGEDGRPVVDLREGKRLWHEWVVEGEEEKVKEKL